MNQELMGKFIAQERKNKRLTQEQLAEKIKVDRTVVSRWERGVSAPDISLLKDLAEILNVSVVELLNCEKDEKIINNDDVMIGAIKFYKNKVMKKMITLLIIVVIILLTVFITSSVVSKRNYFTIEKISYNGDFTTSGYYFANEFGKSILFIKSLNYNGNYLGTINEPVTDSIEVTLLTQNSIILKENFSCESDYSEDCSLSNILKNYSVVVELKNNKYDLEDFYLSIHYYDNNLKEKYFSFPLKD